MRSGAQTADWPVAPEAAACCRGPRAFLTSRPRSRARPQRCAGGHAGVWRRSAPPRHAGRTRATTRRRREAGPPPSAPRRVLSARALPRWGRLRRRPPRATSTRQVDPPWARQRHLFRGKKPAVRNRAPLAGFDAAGRAVRLRRPGDRAWPCSPERTWRPLAVWPPRGRPSRSEAARLRAGSGNHVVATPRVGAAVWPAHGAHARVRDMLRGNHDV